MANPYKDRVLARVILESLITNGKVDIEEAQLYNDIVNDIVENYNRVAIEINESLMYEAQRAQALEEAQRAQVKPQAQTQPQPLEENTFSFSKLNVISRML